MGSIISSIPSPLSTLVSYSMILHGISIFIALQTQTAPYGRYSRKGYGFLVPVKFAGVVQYLPSFVVPLLVIYFTECPYGNNRLNQFAVGMFVLHYFQRTFIYPLLIRGGKPTPMVLFGVAFFFCGINGWLQAAHLCKLNNLVTGPCPYVRMAVGTSVFCTGMLINLHSDHVLRNLRGPGESGYKIPNGGMFTYVSGANFFGEQIEWIGFAIFCASLPATAFAFFTFCNTGPRACHHHAWYRENFEDYPGNRHALVPFVW